MDPHEAGERRLFSAALGPRAVPSSLLASEAWRDQVLGACVWARRGLQEPRVTDTPGPSHPRPHRTSVGHGAPVDAWVHSEGPGASSPSQTLRGVREWLPGGGRAWKVIKITRCFVIIYYRSLCDRV